MKNLFQTGRAALSFLVPLILFVAAGAAAATPPQLSSAELQGRKLAQELCNSQPGENFTNTGVLQIRAGDGKRFEPLVTVETTVKRDGWQTLYFATLNNGKGHFESALTVTHADGKPNAYHLTETGPAGHFETNLNGDATMIPFAHSDFWIADLGLEFLHWPAQKILPNPTSLKRGRSYTLLESTNPAPSTNAYSRVLSWIDKETGGLLQAEAYDAQGKLLKEFAPKSFKKVNGQWELQEMEIDNDQTGSRTRLEFDLPKNRRDG